MAWAPTVTVAIPVRDEARHIEACLDAVAAQSYESVCEVLVMDGGSTDGTRAVVEARSDALLLDNPRRAQAAGLNVALEVARGEVFVRVDGHTIVSGDYVARCVEALARTGAAMVGGTMSSIAAPGWAAGGIAAAMTSRLGAGPARFRRPSCRAGWVDTVYLGAFRTELARSLGGYAEGLAINEDAELAWRMRAKGGIWLDPTIRSTYVPRDSLRALGRQFWRYGQGRAATIRRDPRSAALRQLLPPGLVVGLLSPWRRYVLGAYVAVVAGRVGLGKARAEPGAYGLGAALPVMHLCWGAGLLAGLALGELGHEPA